MSIKLEKSNTKINLMRAFSGESQVRNRYTFAASQALKDGLKVIEFIFSTIADQERQHAKIYFNELKPFSGSNLNIEGGFPIIVSNDILDLIKNARHNEYEEYNDVYKSFGEEALSEGFNEIAETFFRISKIEKSHGDRFNTLVNLMETNTLFESEKEEEWLCLQCGNLYKSKSAPNPCPVCKHGKGFQIRHKWILMNNK